MARSFGAVVQRLASPRDRVLAVGHVAQVRTEDARFRPAQVASLFDALRVPPPSNVSEYLSRLAKDDLVIRRAGGGWSLTPLGEERLKALLGDVDISAVEVEQHEAGSASFAGVEHPLIPPEFAPIRYQSAINRILSESPFERNVFCMTRFPPAGAADDPLARAIATTRETLRSRGLIMHLASDRQADDELFQNVAAHIWSCKYGVAFLETLDDHPGDQLNDNVLIEVGAMLVTGRRCCLLKDPSAPSPPTDFVAQIYKETELSEAAAVDEAVTAWVRDDLGL
jgi:hypothetical protein